MKLLSFETLREGQCLPEAWISFGKTIDTMDGKGIYLSIVLPIPIFELWENFLNGHFYQGERAFRFIVEIRKNYHGEWRYRFDKCKHILSKALIATRKEYKDKSLDAQTLLGVNLAKGRW